MKAAREPVPPALDFDPVVRDHPLNQGRRGWWMARPWNQGGPTYYDLLGRNHGTLTGFPASGATYGWRTGSRPGGSGAIQFGQVSPQAKVPISPMGVGSVAAAVTTHFWGYTTTATQSIYTSPFYVGPGTIYVPTSNGTFSYAWAGLSAEYDWTGGPAIPTNQWFLAALVITPSQATIYVGRGGSIVSATRVAANSTQTFVSNPAIGADPQVTNARAWNGLIDDVSYIDRSWTAAEFAAYYDESRRGYPETIRRYRPGLFLFIPPPVVFSFAATAGPATLAASLATAAPSPASAAFAGTAGPAMLTAFAATNAPPGSSVAFAAAAGPASLAASLATATPPGASVAFAAAAGSATFAASAIFSAGQVNFRLVSTVLVSAGYPDPLCSTVKPL